MPRSLLATIIFFSILSFSFSQNQRTDSLKAQLISVEDDSIKLDLLLRLADVNARVNTDSFYHYSRQALALGNKIKSSDGIKKSTANVAYFFRHDGVYDSALYYYNVSLQNHSEVDSDLPMTLYSIGNVYKAMDNFSEANAYYLKSLQSSDDQENTQGKAIANLGLGSLYIAQKEIEKSIEFFKNALSSFEEAKDQRGVYIAINNIGTSLFEIRDYKGAKPYFQKARMTAEKGNDIRSLGDIYSNLGSILEAEQDYDSSIYFHEKALGIRKKLGAKQGQVKSYHNIASVNIFRAKFGIAEVYLDSAYQLIDELNSVVELKYYWNYKIMLDTARKDFSSATKSLFKYMSLKDQVEDTDLKAEIAELQTKYETEKKDQEIQNLSQQAQIQSLQLNQQQLFSGGLAIILVLLIAGGIILYRQRKLREAQAIGNMEQRLLRTQMNPHFIFNALGSIQNFMLKKDTEQASAYLSKFGKLMRQILEHSREEFISLEEERETLENYFEIQKLRFPNVFDYSIQIDKSLDTEETMIPPMLAQPFLENAIEHGMSNRKEGGLIEVKFSKEGNLIKLEVLDNGEGVGQASSKEHKSLSTKITRERLELLGRNVKRKLTLLIENNENDKSLSGTRVELLMPFRQ